MFENVYHIILMTTRDCNLNCSYCFEKNKKKYAGERMTFDQFKAIIDRIVKDRQKDCREQQSPILDIGFHGGEPTLLGAAEIQRFMAYAKAKLPGVGFGLQTNGTLLDASWFSIFRNVSCGLSMDGLSRKDNTFRSLAINYRKLLQFLRKHKISVSPLMVVGRHNVHGLIFKIHQLLSACRCQELRANVLEDIDKPYLTKIELTSDEMYTKIFIPVMQHFLRTGRLVETRVGQIIRSFISAWLFEPLTKRQRLCDAKFCGGGNFMLLVNPDGSVGFCQRWRDEEPLKNIGHITDVDLFGLSSLRKTVKVHLLKIEDMRKKHCDLCMAADLCSYGCVAFAQAKYGKMYIREDRVCDYYKKIKMFCVLQRHHILYKFIKKNFPKHPKNENTYYVRQFPQMKARVDTQIGWLKIMQEKETQRYIVVIDEQAYKREK